MTQLDVDREVEQRLRGVEPRTAGVAAEPLRWLALLPEWTDQLADSCQFPYGDAVGLEDMLDSFEWAGLCQVRRERDFAGEERIRFWMPDDVRATLLDHEPALREGLPADAHLLAQKIAAAYEDDPDAVDIESVRWAYLASSELATNVATGTSLNSLVKEALAAEDTALAEEWIAVGRALGDLLGGELKLAVERARRQLQLRYRKLQDARLLSNFVEREEQIDEVRELLAPGPTWAVHFIGQSGVGKTMLMRHLTSSGPSSDPFMCAARIDFDYLDPRFPLESPAQLLGELAEDLAANITSASQEARFLAFSEAVTRCESVTRPGTPEHDVLELLQTEHFGQVVATFAAFLETLPQPVVLVLDTCEELAKLRPPGEEVPSIRATFEILEQVHSATDKVRAVFAGRRWLTKKAANEVRGLATPPAVMGMEPREFMRMYAVRGFTREEVEQYLLEVRGLELGPEMVAAILANTEDRGKPASMAETEGPDEEPRYSPSDVTLFANWIAREPELEPGDLVGGNLDPFIDVRIFQRISSPEVIAAIPAALLLGRFNGEMIAPALGGKPGARERVLKELVEHEWTHLEGGPGLEDIVLSVDRGLLRRLRAYFDRTEDRVRQLEATRAALEPGLARMFERPPGEVRPDLIDSAVKALPPRRTAELLDDLANRVAQTGSWSWAESVCDLLLAPEREPPLDRSLTASAGALYLASLRHRNAGGELAALWATVVRTANLHPDRGMRRVLETRGRLGSVVSAAGNGGAELTWAKAALTRGRLLLSFPGDEDAVAPGLLAAVEALIDSREARGHPIPADNVRACLNRLARHFEHSEIVRAQLLALSGRMEALEGNWAEARLLFDRLERRSLDGDPPNAADWVAPGSMRHRVLLELLRFRLADLNESRRLLNRCEKAALEHSGGADAAQLLSLALQGRLARGELGSAEVDAAAAHECVAATYDPTVPAHSSAPPLFASIAECQLGLGRPDQALALLFDREQAATARRTDEGSTRAAALATIRVLRRQRLRERFGLLAGLSSDLDPEVRAEAMAAGALIAGLRPPRGRESAGDHAAWQARILLDPRGEEEALSLTRRTDPGAEEDDGQALHLALDRLEAELVRARWSPLRRRRVAAAMKEVQRLGGEQWYRAPSLGAPLDEVSLRLGMRYWALLGYQPLRLQAQSLSRRRLQGRLALEEGELLALRLPELSIRLLEMAEGWLHEAGDEGGAFIAALRCAIAEVHAGRSVAALRRRPQIDARYAALRRTHPELPSVKQIKAREGAGAGTVGSDPWRGWTHRLGVYLRWCDGIVPPDAALGIDPETALMPAVGAEGSSISLSVRDRWAPLRNVAIPVLILAVGALAVALLFGDWGDGLAVLVLGAIAFFGAALALALGDLVGPRVSANLPIESFELTLVTGPPDSKGDLCVESRLQPRARGRLTNMALSLVRASPLRSNWFTRFTLDAKTVGMPPPRTLAIAAAARADNQPVPIRLSVSSFLAPLAWERWLIGDRAWKEGLREVPDIWRVRSLPLLALPEGIWPQQLVAACSTLWRPFVESSAADGTTWASRILPGTPARAVVALGIPVYTRAGWRLRLDDDLPSAETGDSASHSQLLLSPDRLAWQAPVAIVIGRPGGELVPNEKLGNDLRSFANEAFLAGTRAVITVPSLPAEQASQVISVLTSELITWASVPDVMQLRRLTSRVRSLICFAEGGGEALSQNELERRTRSVLALDVCLFASS